MTKKLWFSLNQLKQVAPFMSDEQSRFYICSVFVDPAGYFVATDGHRMGVLNVPSILKSGCGGNMLAAPVVNQALKVKPLTRGHDIVMTWDLQTLSVYSLPAGLVDVALEGKADAGDLAPMLSVPAKPHEGTFPDWRRVIPQLPGVALGCSGVRMNPDYLKAFKSVNSRTDAVCIYPSDVECSAAMIVTNGNPDFLGVLMPTRNRTSYPEARAMSERVRNGAGVIKAA